MFGIAYGFYQSVIGFAVMFLFEACAFVLAVLGVTRTRDVKTDNELFDLTDAAIINKFNRTLSMFSFSSFFIIFAAVLLSVPFLIETGGVLTFGSYVFGTLWFSVSILILVYFGAKNKYIAWITDTPYTRILDPKLKKMNFLQIGAVIIAGLLFVIAPYFEKGWQETSYTVIVLNMIALAFFVANVICFIVCIIKYKDRRKYLILPGIRNMLYNISAFFIAGFHHISYYQFAGSTVYERYDSWNHEYLVYSLGAALLISVLFKVIEKLILRRKH